MGGKKKPSSPKRKPRGPKKTPALPVAPNVEQLAAEAAKLSQDQTAIHERRYKLMQLLALRQMSYAKIAEQLNVSLSTVERDLVEIRTGWRQQFGASSKFDPAEAIGDAIELYASVEEAAHREYLRLNRDHLAEISNELKRIAALPEGAPNKPELLAAATASIGVAAENVLKFSRERQRALRLRADTRQRRVAFLQDIGLLDRHLGKLDLPDELLNLTGDQLDSWMQDVTAISAEIFLPAAERPIAGSGKKPH